MAHLILPNGKGHGWRPDTPDPVNDRQLRRRAGLTAPLPQGEIYLDPAALPPVRDQGAQGSCTGHGTTGALMWSLRAKKGKTADLSPAFAYLQGRIIEGSVKEDSGCEIRDVVKGIAGNGCSLTKYMPYDAAKLPIKASKTACANAMSHQIKVGYYRAADRSVDDLLRALGANLPVVGGYSWFSCLDTADFERTGVMPVPRPGDKLEGGHCNWLCGVDVPSRMFLWQNSYGPSFGAKHPKTGLGGYVLMPFAYVEQGLCDDNWAIDHE